MTQIISGDKLIKNSQELVKILQEKKLKIATAESCTGGLLSFLITEIPGASLVFDRGFVVYCNDAKIQNLGVDPEILQNFGAVSQQAAKEMAIGALKNSKADIAIATTGIAGPDGGTFEKPVGLVYIAVAAKNKIEVKKFNFEGNRTQIRELTAINSFEIAKNFLNNL